MIFIDANVFLRYLTVPRNAREATNGQRAKKLLRQIRDGGIEATTSDAVVAEVAFILTSDRHCGATRPDAVIGIAALVGLSALKWPSKDECLLALDVWERSPTLSFPDALTVAHSVLRGQEVATFDRRLAEAAGVTLYAFDDAGSE